MTLVASVLRQSMGVIEARNSCHAQRAARYLLDLNNASFFARYFVEGIEGSVCQDASSKVWYVIGGFAVVSISLFVVAVAFRLLLQQKEVRDYLYSASNSSGGMRISGLKGHGKSIYECSLIGNSELFVTASHNM